MSAKKTAKRPAAKAAKKTTAAKRPVAAKAPKKAAPKKAVPKKAAPKKAVPKKAVPKEAAPKRAVAAKALPRKAPKRDTSDYETVSWWEDFYRVVRLVPSGRVTTYGAVAAFGGHPRSARHVGYAMAALKDTGKNADVPWHRVLGAASRDRAKVAIKDPIGGSIQRGLLESEGVTFDARDRVSLSSFGWAGPTARRAAKKTAKPKR